jgi:hypothetical protein
MAPAPKASAAAVVADAVAKPDACSISAATMACQPPDARLARLPARSMRS